MYTKNGQIILDTFDNGRGFDQDAQITANKGLGLLNLQSRGVVLDARFNMHSSPKEGTSYNFEIPQHLEK